MDINAVFCRTLLKDVLKEVRRHLPATELKKVWVRRVMKGHWEFHYEDFYWHGRADNAAEARYNGWEAWLQKHRPELRDYLP